MWIAKSSAVRFVSRLIRPSIAVLFWAWAREACAAVHAARETETERHMATVRRLRSGFALVLLLFIQRAYEMTRGNVNLIVAMDEAIVDKEVLNFKFVHTARLLCPEVCSHNHMAQASILIQLGVGHLRIQVGA